MCAAVMFFSSCSKEDNGSVDTKEVNNQTEVNATKAITVSAKQKSSVSKVALGIENQGKYEEVFSEGEVLKLYLNGDEIASLDIQSGQGTTSATFSGEIPLSADGQTISAKILPKETPSGLTECADFATAVSNYASLYGTFTYNASADNFSLTLDDEVSYFVVKTNMSAVDINTDTYGSSVVFAFNEDQTVSSTALKLNNVELTAGGTVYFKTLNLVTSITLNKTATEIFVGDKETLTATSVSPANATDKTYTWSSSDETIATVDANGKVTAVAVGTTTIKATANDGSGVKDECTVTVKMPVKLADAFENGAVVNVRFKLALNDYNATVTGTYNGNNYANVSCDNTWIPNQTASLSKSGNNIIAYLSNFYGDMTITFDATNNTYTITSAGGRRVGAYYPTGLEYITVNGEKVNVTQN